MMQQERAARYSDLFGGADQHEHPPECAYCPICSTIRVVRNTKPEVLDHLASAVRELVAAAGILLEEAEGFIGHPDTTPGPQEPAKVRRIDVG